MSGENNNGRRDVNFLINASNQANLAGTKAVDANQINAVFILISPYYIDSFNMAELDIDIRIDETGTLTVGGQSFKPIEIVKGVKIIGILQS